MRTYSRVVAYIWETTPEERERVGTDFVEIPALEFWPEYPKWEWNDDGKRFIYVPEPFRSWRQPDLELLECGCEQPIRRWGGKKYYNRRRRCNTCAMAL